MARTIDANTAYRVRLHINGGYRYASTQPMIEDSDRESGRNKHRRVHWGTVDDNMKFHPNHMYIATPPEERAKLVWQSVPDSGRTWRRRSTATKRWQTPY